MNKLEVGMYIRTLKGIAKIIGQNDDVRFHYPLAYVCDRYLEINDDTEYLYEEDIIKFSHNIIDLIEVGDYVNGYEVIEKPYTYHDIQFVSVDTKNSWGWGEGEMPIENIKSIVTKEQFKSMEYEVGDDNE